MVRSNNLSYNAFVQIRFSRSRDIHCLFSFRQLVGTPNGDLKANYFFSVSDGC